MCISSRLDHLVTLEINMDKLIKKAEKGIKKAEKVMKHVEKADKKRDKLVEKGKKKNMC